MNATIGICNGEKIPSIIFKGNIVQLQVVCIGSVPIWTKPRIGSVAGDIVV